MHFKCAARIKVKTCCIRHCMQRKDIERVYKTAVDAIRARRGARALTGVRVPNLYRSGKYTITGLLFVYFVSHMRQIVRIEDLVTFLRQKGLCKTMSPNPRHLGMQYGFYFLVKDCFHPIQHRALRAGEYCLYSLSRVHPSFSTSHAATRKKRYHDKRYEAEAASNGEEPRMMMATTPASRRASLISPEEFADMKKKSDSRCRVCGSVEGMPNLKNRVLTTRLEMGHCHPLRPLTRDNCIPMCQFCNHVYGNRFVFSANGIIHSALCNVNTATRHDHHLPPPQKKKTIVYSVPPAEQIQIPRRSARLASKNVSR